MQTKPDFIDRDDAVTALRTFIATGSFRPGDRLPPERELTVMLDMSRNTLRGALDALEREGAIWRHVGKGTFVAAHGDSADTGSLAELTRQVTPVRLMRARLSLEPAIAREAGIATNVVHWYFDTKDDRHFQSWFRFHHKPGDKVPIEFIRRGQRKKITLTAVK